jgi:hypothetical protein
MAWAAVPLLGQSIQIFGEVLARFPVFASSRAPPLRLTFRPYFLT